MIVSTRWSSVRAGGAETGGGVLRLGEQPEKTASKRAAAKSRSGPGRFPQWGCRIFSSAAFMASQAEDA